MPSERKDFIVEEEMQIKIFVHNKELACPVFCQINEEVMLWVRGLLLNYLNTSSVFFCLYDITVSHARCIMLFIVSILAQIRAVFMEKKVG